MTNKQLERGIELKSLIDNLLEKKERLERIRDICFENMDIAKENTHFFSIESIREDGWEKDSVEISAHAAYWGLCKDIEKINEERERLRKEYSDL